MRHKPRLCLDPDKGIMIDAMPAFALFPFVPEIGASAGIGAFGGQAFGAVLDVYLTMAAEVDCVQDLAHRQISWLRLFGCCVSGLV